MLQKESRDFYEDLLGVAPLLESVAHDIAMVKLAIRDLDKFTIESLIAKIPYLKLIKFRKKFKNPLLKRNHLNASVNYLVPMAPREAMKSTFESQNQTRVPGGCIMWSPQDEHEEFLQYGYNNEWQESKQKRRHSETADNAILRSKSSNAEDFLNTSTALKTETRHISGSNFFEQWATRAVQERENLSKSAVNCSRVKKKKLRKAKDKSVETHAHKNIVKEANAESSENFNKGLYQEVNVRYKPTTGLQQPADITNVQYTKCNTTSGSAHRKTNQARKVFPEAATGGNIPVYGTQAKVEIVKGENNEKSKNAHMKPKKSSYRRATSRFVKRSRRRCPKSSTYHYAGKEIPSGKNKHKTRRWQKRASHRFRGLQINRKTRKRRRRLANQRTDKKLPSTCEHSPTKFVAASQTPNCTSPSLHSDESEDEPHVPDTSTSRLQDDEIGDEPHVPDTSTSRSQDDEMLVYSHVWTGKQELIRPIIISYNKDPRKMCHSLTIRPWNGSSVDGMKHSLFDSIKPSVSEEEDGDIKDTVDIGTITVTSKDTRTARSTKRNPYFTKDPFELDGRHFCSERLFNIGPSVCQDFNNSALPQMQKLSDKCKTSNVLCNERCNPLDSVATMNCVNAGHREEKPLRLPALPKTTRGSLFSNDGSRITGTDKASTAVSYASVNTNQNNVWKGNVKNDRITNDNKKLPDLSEKLKNNSEVLLSEANNEMLNISRSLRILSSPLTVQNSSPAHFHSSKTKHETWKNNIFTKSYPISGPENNIQELSDSKEILFPAIPISSLPNFAGRKECQHNGCTIECQDYSPADHSLRDESCLKKNQFLDEHCHIDISSKAHARSRCHECAPRQSISLKPYDTQQGKEEIHVDQGDKSEKMKYEVPSRTAQHACKTSNNSNTNNNAKEEGDEDEPSQAVESDDSSSDVCETSDSTVDSFISSTDLTHEGVLEDHYTDDHCQEHHNKDHRRCNLCSNREGVSCTDSESPGSSTEVIDELEQELQSLMDDYPNARLNTAADVSEHSFHPIESVGESLNRSVNNPIRREAHRRCLHGQTEINHRQRDARHREQLKRRRNIPVLDENEDLGVYSNACDLYQRESNAEPQLQQHSCSLPNRDAWENKFAIKCCKGDYKNCSQEVGRNLFCPTTKSSWETAAREHVLNSSQHKNQLITTFSNRYKSATCNPRPQQNNSELPSNATRVQNAEQYVNNRMYCDDIHMSNEHRNFFRGHSHDRSLDVPEHNRKRRHQDLESFESDEDDEQISKKPSHMDTSSTTNFNEVSPSKENIISGNPWNEDDLRYKHNGANFAEQVSSHESLHLRNTSPGPSGTSPPKYRNLNSSPHRDCQNARVSKNLKRKHGSNSPSLSSSSSERSRNLQLFREDANNPPGYISKNKEQNPLSRYVQLKHSRTCRRRHVMNGDVCCNRCLPSPSLHLNKSPVIKKRRTSSVARNRVELKRAVLKPRSRISKRSRLKPPSRRPKRSSLKSSSRGPKRSSLKSSSRGPKRSSLKSPSRRLKRSRLKSPSRRSKRSSLKSPSRRSKRSSLKSPSRRPKRSSLKTPSRRPKRSSLKSPSRRLKYASLKSLSRIPKRASLKSLSRRLKHLSLKSSSRRPKRSNLKPPRHRPKRSSLKSPKRRSKRSSLRSPSRRPKRSSLKSPNRRLKCSSLKSPSRRLKRSSLKSPSRRLKRSSLKSPSRRLKRSSLKSPSGRTKRSSLKSPSRRPKRSSLKSPSRRPKRSSLKSPSRRPKRSGLNLPAVDPNVEVGSLPTVDPNIQV